MRTMYNCDCHMASHWPTKGTAYTCLHQCSLTVSCVQIAGRAGFQPGLLFRLRQLRDPQGSFNRSWSVSTLKAYSSLGCLEESRAQFEPGSGFASSEEERGSIGALIDDGQSAVGWEPRQDEVAETGFIGGRLSVEAAPIQVAHLVQSAARDSCAVAGGAAGGDRWWLWDHG